MVVGDYIKITCETSTLTHYYVAHSGDPIIYMATYTTAGQFNQTLTHREIISDCLQNPPSENSAISPVSTPTSSRMKNPSAPRPTSPMALP